MLIQTVGYLVDRVWIGLRLSGTNQVPAWEDGTPLQTGFWNMGGESRTMGCVYVDQGVKTEDSWVNAPCELLNNWLCEKAMVS
ncbi:hypothetical protein NHX12_001016 [Muraenolepis orangiensis]|uniref:C-type lectin domain-containing protein n=1 Tax=Muraenolepis orangiensis TaxID=630683 RepID=A0A9Q0IGV9_9TELE|nr:hypothetical protein NHX12_001016 [Muraenolepis orangiensis]